MNKCSPLFISALSLVITGCSSLADQASKANGSDPVATLHSGWSLVWHDEFSGDAIDNAKWSHEQNCWGGGNQEQQCYVNDAKNAFVKDGMLTIRAIKGDTTGPNQAEGSEGYGKTLTTLPYSSARLRSIHKGDWKYGRFEIRAKLPEGQGTWPAIWMLPTEWEYTGWAASGEIDIMEAVNLGTTYVEKGVTKKENRVHGTLHFGKQWPGNVQAGVEYDFGNENISPADDFYTYAVEWEKDEIRWYVDDVHYATQTSNGWWSQYQDAAGEWVSGPGDAPYNQKFHMILNLAMGGTWPSAVNHGGIDTSITQADMQVDYVRVYQCSINPQTGKGCASPASNKALAHQGVAEPDLPATMDLSASTLTLFDGELTAGIQLNGWDNSTNDTRVMSGDGVYISIIEQGNAYFGFARGAQNMSSFREGKLSFDLTLHKGVADGLAIKVDGGYPALAPITIPFSQLPAVGESRRYTFAVEDFIAAGSHGFSIKRVVNPLVFEPVNNVDLAFSINQVMFTKMK